MKLKGFYIGVLAVLIFLLSGCQEKTEISVFDIDSTNIDMWDVYIEQLIEQKAYYKANITLYQYFDMLKDNENLPDKIKEQALQSLLSYGHELMGHGVSVGYWYNQLQPKHVDLTAIGTSYMPQETIDLKEPRGLTLKYTLDGSNPMDTGIAAKKIILEGQEGDVELSVVYMNRFGIYGPTTTRKIHVDVPEEAPKEIPEEVLDKIPGETAGEDGTDQEDLENPKPRDGVTIQIALFGFEASVNQAYQDLFKSLESEGIYAQAKVYKTLSEVDYSQLPDVLISQANYAQDVSAYGIALAVDEVMDMEAYTYYGDALNAGRFKGKTYVLPLTIRPNEVSSASSPEIVLGLYYGLGGDILDTEYEAIEMDEKLLADAVAMYNAQTMDVDPILYNHISGMMVSRFAIIGADGEAKKTMITQMYKYLYGHPEALEQVSLAEGSTVVFETNQDIDDEKKQRIEGNVSTIQSYSLQNIYNQIREKIEN